MADGRTHAKAATATGIALSLAAAYVSLAGDAQAGLALAGGAWAGWLIDPDLDQPGRTHTENRITRNLGPLAGGAWRALWAPYAILIPHRSPLSHWPGLGTLIRAGYLYALAAGLAYLFRLSLPPIPWALAGHALAAWAIQDLIHFALDDWRTH